MADLLGQRLVVGVGKPRRGKHGKRPGPPVHDDLCAYVDRRGVTRHTSSLPAPRTSCG